MTKNIKPKIYILAFLISAAVTMIIYAACGIWPFGDRSVLIDDMGRQFSIFYQYFKTIFTTDQDMAYTFSKTMGGDMSGFCSYYLNSPLFFILFLFPGEKIAEGIEVLILLQTALCGLTASIFLNNMNRPSYSSLIFSTAWSGMGFISAYFILTSYFTDLALLPLVILAFYKYLNENDSDPVTDSKTPQRKEPVKRIPKWRICFILLTALYIFMNYYLGYMLVLFIAILLAAEVIKDTGRLKLLPEVIFSLIVSFCLDGVMLLTTALSLRGQKSSLSADFAFYRRFIPSDFLSALLAANDKPSQLPMVYCSLIAVIMLLAFFITKRPVRDKLAALFVLALLYSSMWINTLDAVWHGFNNPQGFPYRYSYFFSGTIIFLGYRAYIHITEKDVQADSRDPEDSEEPKKGGAGVIISFVIMFLLPVLLYVLKNPYVSLKRVIINEVFICIMAVMVFLIRRNKKASARKADSGQTDKSAVLTILCIIAVTAEVCCSAVLTFRAFNVDEGSGLPYISEFHENYEKIKNAVDTCRPENDELYRIEKDFFYSPNDPMLFDYPGLSHYSSCEKAEVRHFMERMGFRDTGVYAYYNQGSTAFADIFSGVRYFISRFDETYKPYSYVSRAGDYHVYENPFALSLAFAADEKIRDLDMESDNIFEIQNRLSKLLGDPNGKDIYLRADPDRKETDDGLIYTIHITEKLPLYFYFDSEDTDPVEVYVNGTDWGHYFTDTDRGMLNAGIYEPGTDVEISLKAQGEKINVSEAYFYYEDREAIGEWYDKIKDKKTSSVISKETSSKLSYDIDVPEDELILMSIPYDKGWKIKVDGKTVKPEKVMGALLAIPSGSGLHKVEMNYIPEGFFPGLAISVLGLVLLSTVVTVQKPPGSEQLRASGH